MSVNRRTASTLVVLLAAALVVGCAPGNWRWHPDTGAPANFWAGLWHGLIVIVTFVVSLFTKDAGIYETHNVGWGYNIGFILGCVISLGGGVRASTHRRRWRREADWDRVGRHIGNGIREGLSSLRTAEWSGESDADWDELGRRIEERVREELKKRSD
jgi:hypothetical protein